jgi:hypothetical protein
MNFSNIKNAIKSRTYNGKVIIRSIVECDGGHVVVYHVHYTRGSREPEQRVAYVTTPHYSVPFNMIAAQERIVK